MRTRFLLVSLATVGLTTWVAAHDPARSPAGNAGDPPDFGNCQSCHADSANNAGDAATRLNGLPTHWSPGTTYRIEVEMEWPGSTLLTWGFQINAADADAQQIGSFTLVDPDTDLLVDQGREYVRNSGSAAGTRFGVQGGPVSWEIDWTAPTAGSGTAFFYLGTLVGNADGSPLGDFVFTHASASLEEGDGAALSVTLQPDGAAVPEGDTAVVRATVRNHAATQQDAVLVARVELPTGGFFPPSGFLLAPIVVDLGVGEQQTFDLLHPIPAGTPPVTVRYEALVGVAPATVLAEGSFDLTVLP